MATTYKNLFKTWQSDFERHVEHIHELIEKPNKYKMAQKDLKEFNEYRIGLVKYVEATNRFKENLVEGVLSHEENCDCKEIRDREKAERLLKE